MSAVLDGLAIGVFWVTVVAAILATIAALVGSIDHPIWLVYIFAAHVWVALFFRGVEKVQEIGRHP